MTVEDVKELAHIESTIKHRKEDVELKCNFEFDGSPREWKVCRLGTGCMAGRTANDVKVTATQN